MHKSLPVLFHAFEVLNGWMPRDRYYGSINTGLIIFLILEKKIFIFNQPTMWFLWQYAASPENTLKVQYFILSDVFSRAVVSLYKELLFFLISDELLIFMHKNFVLFEIISLNFSPYYLEEKKTGMLLVHYTVKAKIFTVFINILIRFTCIP